MAEAERQVADRSILPVYLRHMARWKVLSREQELELAAELHETRKTLIATLDRDSGRGEAARAQDGWSDARIAESCRELLRRRGSSAAMQELSRLARRFEWLRTELVRHNLRLVVHLAKRRARGEMPLLDLIQEGNIGLMKAVERFDAERDCRFSTYAYWWIKQAMDRAAVNQGQMIRIPAHLESRIRRVRRAMRDLMNEDGEPPDREEAARRLGLPLEEVEHLLRVSRETSLAKAVESDDDEGWDPLDQLTDDGDGSPQRRLFERERRREVQALLEKLSPKERDIVRRRFGLLDGASAQTFDEIAAEAGLSRERVRQLLLRALKKIGATQAARRLRSGRTAH